MKEIISLKDDLIKETVKLHQKKYRENFILLEGNKALEGAVSNNLKIKYIFSADKKLLEEYKNYETYFVTDEIMKKISTTESPSNIISVAQKPKYSIDDFYKFKKITLLDNIKDAGNLGTIIRASAAFNYEGIILYNDTVDEFSPKVIRSAAGNIFKIPVIKISKGELLKFKKTHKFVATVVNSDKTPKDIKIDSNTIVMFGSEADGLCEELLNLSDEKITIKMANDVESLNLALCAGIILYLL